MTGFSPLRAGVHGFAWTAENPLSAGFVALITALVAVIGAVLALIAIGGPEALSLPIDLHALWTSVPDASPMRQAASVGALLLTGLMAQGVVMRALTGGGADALRLAPRLGEDELRLFVCWLLGAFAVATPPALLGGAGLAWGLSTDLPMLAQVGAVIGAVISAVFLIRFSQSAPATVSRRKLSFFRAWDASLGAFWSMLSAYVIAAFLAALFAAVVVALGVVAAPGIELSQALEMVRSEPATVFMTPTVAIPLMLASGGLLFITAAPAAFAYQRFGEAEAPNHEPSVVALSDAPIEVADG